jgi:sulfane dehydrogenase subunit SoxC
MGYLPRRKSALISICVLATLISCACNRDLTTPTRPTTTSASKPLAADNAQGGSLLIIDGLVEAPLRLSYQDVTTRYPAVMVEAVLYCPGVYENQPVRYWYGIPVSTIISSAGLKPEASRLVFYASDGFTTTLSIAKINETRAILAFKVDGATLSQADGYPFTLVSNDLIGDMWIKWVGRIEVA